MVKTWFLFSVLALAGDAAGPFSLPPGRKNLTHSHVGGAETLLSRSSLPANLRASRRTALMRPWPALGTRAALSGFGVGRCLRRGDQAPQWSETFAPLRPSKRERTTSLVIKRDSFARSRRNPLGCERTISTPITLSAAASRGTPGCRRQSRHPHAAARISPVARGGSTGRVRALARSSASECAGRFARPSPARRGRRSTARRRGPSPSPAYRKVYMAAPQRLDCCWPTPVCPF